MLKQYISTIVKTDIKRPQCVNCKHFIQNPYTDNYNYGLCSIFNVNLSGNNSSYDKFKRKSEFSYTFMPCSLARDTHLLCGKSGKFYKEK